MSDEKRRKLLKSIAAGSGAVITGKSLPESWSRPVVESVALPVHAETTRTCCAGVFCDLIIEGPIDGYAQVSSDCTIFMGGNSIDGLWSGSGTVEEDGTFAFTVNFEVGATAQVTGFVIQDCLRISGNMTGPWGPFSAPINQGVTSPGQCPDG